MKLETLKILHNAAADTAQLAFKSGVDLEVIKELVKHQLVLSKQLTEAREKSLQYSKMGIAI